MYDALDPISKFFKNLLISGVCQFLAWAASTLINAYQLFLYSINQFVSSSLSFYNTNQTVSPPDVTQWVFLWSLFILIFMIIVGHDSPYEDKTDIIPIISGLSIVGSLLILPLILLYSAITIIFLILSVEAGVAGYLLGSAIEDIIYAIKERIGWES